MMRQPFRANQTGKPSDLSLLPLPMKIAFSVIPCIFGVIGLGLLFNFWFTSSDGFGDAPIIFKFVGSCIALGFVAMSSIFIMSIWIFKKSHVDSVREGFQDLAEDLQELQEESQKGIGYNCPRCAGKLGDDADVSPLGDVKCAYCDTWFNVHGKR